MKDWRELPAGDGIDIVIAQAVGYQIKYLPGYTALIHPNGDEIARGFHDAPKGYMWSQAYEFSNIPHYSTDANATLALLMALPKQWTFTISRYDEHEVFCCAISPSGTKASFDSWQVFTAGTPALAICRAWLDWHEKQLTTK